MVGTRLFFLWAGVVLFHFVGKSHAQITPDWITRIPLNSSISTGVVAVAVGADGIVYITGTTGLSYNTDTFTAAISPNGTVLWSHIFNGANNGNDQASGIAIGPGGNLYVSGNTAGVNNYSNFLLLKYDLGTGALQNVTHLRAGPGISEAGGPVAVDRSGNVFVAGSTTDDGYDVTLLKFNAAGDLIWRRIWDGPANAPYSQDSAKRLLLDPNGNPVVLIHGVMNDLQPDYVVVKYAADTGDIVWQATWGGRASESPVDMEMDARGDFFVTGQATVSTAVYSTIKLRGTDGQLLWQAYDSRLFHNLPADLSLDSQGNVYVTGRIDPDGNRDNLNDNFYSVKRRGDDGSLAWTHEFGAACFGCVDRPPAILTDSAGNTYLVGVTSSPPYAGDMILFVLNALTGVEVARSVVDGGAAVIPYVRFLRFDSAENLLVVGYYYNADTGAVDMAVLKYHSRSHRLGDVNGDGCVSDTDLLLLLFAFGQSGQNLPEDLNRDGIVDDLDLLEVLFNFGQGC